MKTLQIANIVAFIAMVALNYIANTGFINGETMASVSAEYNNLFTPAGYAFSIWGLIYLGLAVFVIFQAISVRGKKLVPKIGWWFVISCLLNMSWIFAWLFHYIDTSVIIMSLLLISLLIIVFRTRMELDDEPLPVIAFFWWPFSFYSGWISVALIANVAAFLTSIDWNGFGISEVTWTIIMIIVAGIINVTITWTRNMREFALVGAWGIIAVGIANKEDVNVIYYTAIAAAAVLVISSGMHGYKNRHYSPWRKL
ncbi:tryptophan-rich sensory protein [Salinimicrobium sp. HB62]|uniref:tryptophan-rich sensory protein n=1 Tax=Salinimicrobium sp. HB62 TaxID=3077781 RepID=UPI002D776471|nr:tryptophan-rich sensory protein [Salinimicrobium sp. HB62]